MANYNELVQEHAEQALAYYDGARDSALRSGLAPLAEYGFPLGKWPMILTPTSVSADAADRAQAGFDAVIAAARLVIEGHYQLHWRALAPQVGIAEHQIRLLETIEYPANWWRIARPDTVFVGDQPKFLELNLISSIGGLAISDLLVRCLRAWPAGNDWLAANPLRFIDTMTALTRDVRGVSASPADLTVVAGWGPYEPETMPPHFYRALAGEFSRRGLRSVHANLVELDWDGRYPRLHGERVGCLYRFFDESDGRLPAKQALFEKLMGHVERGTVGLYGDFVGDAVLNKAFLARLSQWLAADADLLRPLPEPARRALAAVLPWSTVVEAGPAIDPDGQQVDLLGYLRSRQPEFVLKPAEGYHGAHGGAGVLIGRATSPERWQAALRQASGTGRRWVAQHYLATPQLQAVRVWQGRLVSRPYRTVNGLFFVAGRFAGGICRAAPTRRYVVNPSRGAAQGAFGVRPA
jgi:hypothetical protein